MDPQLVETATRDHNTGVLRPRSRPAESGGLQVHKDKMQIYIYIDIDRHIHESIDRQTNIWIHR